MAKERDGVNDGIRSRKMWFCVGSGLVMVACWFVTGSVAALIATFDTLVGGLLAISALYLTGNVSSRLVQARKGQNIPFLDASKEEPAAPSPPALPTKPSIVPTTQKLVVKKPASSEEGS